MATEAVITLIVVASFFVTVLTGKLTIDIALAASMVVLLVLGVLTSVEALLTLPFTLLPASISFLLRLKKAGRSTGG